MTGTIDPAELTAGERSALDLISRFYCVRRKNGYGVRGQKRTVTLAIIRKLTAKGLVRTDIVGRHDMVMATYAGKCTHDVMVQRRKRKENA